MADRHLPTSSPPGGAPTCVDDSILDETARTAPSAGVDPSRPLDSDVKCVRTDIPEQLDLLLPGEAALVYQYLRDRLATLFVDPAA